MGNELINKLMEYREKFNDTFPTIPLLWDNGEEGTIRIIDRCLEEKKTPYQLGMLSTKDVY